MQEIIENKSIENIPVNRYITPLRSYYDSLPYSKKRTLLKRLSAKTGKSESTVRRWINGDFQPESLLEKKLIATITKLPITLIFPEK